MKSKFDLGQSLIEVVFSIGIILVVISGVVFLILATVGAKTKGYDRKMAAEIAQNAIEGMVNTKNDDPVSFWDLGSAYWTQMAQSVTEGDYSHSVAVSHFAGSGCSASRIDCINTLVTINWKGQTMQTFNRFFNRK